jgi:hypothetical protein
MYYARIRTLKARIDSFLFVMQMRLETGHDYQEKMQYVNRCMVTNETE